MHKCRGKLVVSSVSLDVWLPVHSCPLLSWTVPHKHTKKKQYIPWSAFFTSILYCDLSSHVELVVNLCRAIADTQLARHSCRLRTFDAAKARTCRHEEAQGQSAQGHRAQGHISKPHLFPAGCIFDVSFNPVVLTVAKNAMHHMKVKRS